MQFSVASRSAGSRGVCGRCVVLVRVTQPVAVNPFAAARFYWRYLRNPLTSVAELQATHGPFVLLPHPRRPRQAPRPFLVAIGPTFNRDVLGNPESWRTVSIGPGGLAPCVTAAQKSQWLCELLARRRHNRCL